jgi:GT2 family glycosyltransferase
MRDCIVLGSGRSGTSMVAGALAKAGYFMGDRLYPARDANPLGFFEAPEINAINEELLAPCVPAAQRLAAPQRWLARLDATVDAAPEPLRQRMRTLVARAPFCFKDPRFCYTLPAWRGEVGDARFVVVFRDPAVTVASIVRECAVAEYLAGVAMDAERALATWCAMYRQVLRQYCETPPHERARWLFVHYDQMVGPDADGAARLARHLDAPVDAAFPDERFRRSKPAAVTSDEATRLYQELGDLAGFSPPRNVARPAAAARPAPAAPEISVLICTYKRRETLVECLVSFANQTLARERHELVVVVDEAGDGSAEAVRSLATRLPLRLIHRTTNGGLASARSAAVAAARGEKILLVNDDTIAFPDLLERHVSAHARRAPTPVTVLGTFEQPPEQLATGLMRALERCGLVFGYAGLRPDVDHDWTKFWGCNVSAPRREVLAAGAFDACFHHYGCEDTDLGIRLHQRGLPVVYEPAARAWHRHVLSLDDLLRRQETVARAYARLFAKHPEALARSPFASMLHASVASLTDERRRMDGTVARLLPVVRQLAELDCATLDALGGPLRTAADDAVEGLKQVLQKIDPHLWAGGFLEGLADFGVASFRELAQWRGTATNDAPPWPLASAASVKLLAWPDWSDDGELAAIVALADDARLAAPPCLVLRFDRSCDGDLAAAVARFERACAARPAGAPELDVVVVDEPLPPEAFPRLGRAVACALLLPSSFRGERQRFFARVGSSGVRGAEDLLAFVPAAPDGAPRQVEATGSCDGATRDASQRRAAPFSFSSSRNPA